MNIRHIALKNDDTPLLFFCKVFAKDDSCRRLFFASSSKMSQSEFGWKLIIASKPDLEMNYVEQYWVEDD